MSPDTVTIALLEAELIDRVKSVANVGGRAASIFTLDDLMRLTELRSFPCVGVAYNASFPVGKGITDASGLAPSAAMIDHQFLVVIAIEYAYAGQGDTKSGATDLLDAIRKVVLGYRGISSRPWRWMGERPEPGSSIDGVILYSQVWHTAIPAQGSFNS